jgi:hypothetical protein
LQNPLLSGILLLVNLSETPKQISQIPLSEVHKRLKLLAMGAVTALACVASSGPSREQSPQTISKINTESSIQNLIAHQEEEIVSASRYDIETIEQFFEAPTNSVEHSSLQELKTKLRDLENTSRRLARSINSFSIKNKPTQAQYDKGVGDIESYESEINQAVVDLTRYQQKFGSTSNYNLGMGYIATELEPPTRFTNRLDLAKGYQGTPLDVVSKLKTQSTYEARNTICGDIVIENLPLVAGQRSFELTMDDLKDLMSTYLDLAQGGMQAGDTVSEFYKPEVSKNPQALADRMVEIGGLAEMCKAGMVGDVYVVSPPVNESNIITQNMNTAKGGPAIFFKSGPVSKTDLYGFMSEFKNINKKTDFVTFIANNPIFDKDALASEPATQEFKQAVNDANTYSRDHELLHAINAILKKSLIEQGKYVPSKFDFTTEVNADHALLDNAAAMKGWAKFKKIEKKFGMQIPNNLLPANVLNAKKLAERFYTK